MPRETNAAKRERAIETCRRLNERYGPVECFLDHETPFRLVIAVLLSAQTTDAQVNKVTPELFRRWPTPEQMAGATCVELSDVIKSLGFYKTKAKHCIACAQMIVADYGGVVPNEMKELVKLPGVGRRTALRLAIHILRMERESVAEMTESIDRFRNDVKYCAECNNLSDEEVCPICLDDERDRTTICVVEQVADVLSIENTHQYKGLYHVLGGVISPMQGISPSDLKIDLLTERIARGGVKEVILAISTSVEGETTLFYLMNRLRQFPGLKVTSIARGIGFGDELEYVDELTITHALLNRREVE